MNAAQLESDHSPNEITTLVDHDREGRFVFAFCPICDHAEETEDAGHGREKAASDSVTKIKTHLRRAHRAQAVKLKILIAPQQKQAPAHPTN